MVDITGILSLLENILTRGHTYTVPFSLPTTTVRSTIPGVSGIMRPYLLKTFVL